MEPVSVLVPGTAVLMMPLLSAPAWFFVIIAVFLIVRFLQCFSTCEVPKTYLSTAKDDHMANVIHAIPVLRQIYRAPRLWGRNGHLQTGFYGVLGHALLRRQFNKRHAVKLADGTTVTFDVFEPEKDHSSGRDYTLALTPGIANSSESNYIRTCVHFAQEHGYRCVVLNHLGALADVELTSERIFGYGTRLGGVGTRKLSDGMAPFSRSRSLGGMVARQHSRNELQLFWSQKGIAHSKRSCTDELSAMMHRLCELYPQTRFVCIGFSMGANITTQFLCKVDEKCKQRIVAGLSVCQGYDAIKCRSEWPIEFLGAVDIIEQGAPLINEVATQGKTGRQLKPTLPLCLRSSNIYHDWEGGRRAYNYVITENVKRLLRRNYEKAVLPHVRRGVVPIDKVWAATSIYLIDEYYNRRVFGYDTVEEYYDAVSSINMIPKLDVPMVFLNALDDPIIPPCLWMPVKELIQDKRDTCFILTKHGGHLGFLEGHSLAPSSITWLDRFIVQYADAVIKVYDDTTQCATATNNNNNNDN